MDDLPAGTEIERYVVAELLGQGGMAAVYKVTHKTLGTAHALKVLTLGGKKLKTRLVQEGRVQAMLNHPNVLAVRDVLDVDGSPGLLMDFVDGPDLEQWIEATKPTPEQALPIFRQVVEAVRAAHQQGVVHRDLKPANVLMKQLPSGEWQARVADFGLAKALAEDHDKLTLTRSGISMGTPAFMAPEQIKDASSVDRAADIWALGCIFYQLLTGEQAFDGLDIVEIFNRVSGGEYTPAGDIRQGISPRHDALIARCLEILPDRRPKNCDAILAILDGTAEPVSIQDTWEGEFDPQANDLRRSLQPQESLKAPQFTPPPAQRVRKPSDPPAPAQSGPTPVAWAIPLVMAVVIGGGSLLGVLAVIGLANTFGGSVASCSGFAKGPLVFGGVEGDVWDVRADKDVVRSVPSEDSDWEAGEVACTIPAGSKVTLVEDPVRLGRAGIWIRVLPNNVELPEPDEDDDTPEDE